MLQLILALGFILAVVSFTIVLTVTWEAIDGDVYEGRTSARVGRRRTRVAFAVYVGTLAVLLLGGQALL